jgi:hypothetical protein
MLRWQISPKTCDNLVSLSEPGKGSYRNGFLASAQMR